MLLITVALMIEARPIVSALELKLERDLPYPVYSSNQCLLCVTGTGASSSAAATGWAFGRFPGIDSVVNIGFAGAVEQVSRLHAWYLVNSIRDQASGRLHIPDLLWKFDLHEAALLTAGKPVKDSISWDGLVDMEGSGFYEAARQHLSPDRIILLKWVSDHLEDQIDRDLIEERYASSIPDILPVLESLQFDHPEAAKPHADALEQVLQRIRLTETQTQFLGKWLAGYLQRGGSLDPVLDILPESPPPSKTENKRLLEKLKDVLKG